MPRAQSDEATRKLLLEDLSRFAVGGAAESSELRRNAQLFRDHLPIPEHRRVLDDETLLVLGGRGAGKSQLFNVLRRLEDPTSLITQRRTADGSASQYLAGYSASETSFPRPEVLAQINSDDDPDRLRNLWLGLLCGVLLNENVTSGIVAEHLDAATTDILRNRLATPTQWLSVVSEKLEDIANALDRADEFLRDAQRSVIITYDDLDILAAKIVDVYPLVAALLSFWLRNSRRWRRLRCKIFLRTDIFGSDALNFTDSSKLRPLSITLSWSADNLYRLVLKRLLNGTKKTMWQKFVQPGIPATSIKELPPWGLVPQTTELQHKAFMENLVGRWMGTDKRKGDTYRWFLNHLQDSLGDIAPRSFLKLFESSAGRQLQVAPTGTKHLLTPEQIAGALEDVSKDRIQELKEEYPWIETIKRNLNNETVPIERKELRASIVHKSDWSALPKHLADKTNRADFLIDYLASLGILRVASDNRIHVPDIYLFGFGLKRKGGIRRPRIG